MSDPLNHFAKTNKAKGGAGLSCSTAGRCLPGRLRRQFYDPNGSQPALIRPLLHPDRGWGAKMFSRRRENHRRRKRRRAISPHSIGRADARVARAGAGNDGAYLPFRQLRRVAQDMRLGITRLQHPTFEHNEGRVGNRLVGQNSEARPFTARLVGVSPTHIAPLKTEGNRFETLPVSESEREYFSVAYTPAGDVFNPSAGRIFARQIATKNDMCF